MGANGGADFAAGFWAVAPRPSVTGGNADGTGTFTATCSGAVDQAGNAAGPVSVAYTVRWTCVFAGFFQPVDNLLVLNSVTAGRARGPHRADGERGLKQPVV